MTEDKYLLLEKAKNLLPMDETHEHYYTFLFIALRMVGCSITTSVQVIQAESREAEVVVCYHDLYKDLNTYGILMQEGGKRPNLISESDLEKMETESGQPKNNFGQMVWIETITRVPKSSEEFAREIKRIKAELVNPAGG